MKNILIAVSLGFQLFSCSEEERKNIPSQDSTSSSKIIPLVPVDSVAKNTSKNDSVKTDTLPSSIAVIGKVLYNKQYCGGARPSEEMLAEYEKEKALSHSTLVLKNKNGKFTITTDANGNFKSSLPVGTYDVYLTEKMNAEIYPVSKESCGDCLSKPYTTIKIVDGKKNSISIHFKCSPGELLRP